MQFFTTVLALAASVSAAPTSIAQLKPKGIFKIPAGSPDGLYTHTVGIDGTVHTQYHGTLNATTPVADAKRDGTGVHCQSPTVDPSDATAAINGLAAMFGTQPNFSHSISYSSGAAMAFGCDYGNGQTMNGEEFTGFSPSVGTRRRDSSICLVPKHRTVLPRTVWRSAEYPGCFLGKYAPPLFSECFFLANG